MTEPTREWVVEQLIELYRRCGARVPGGRHDLQSALRTARLLASYAGFVGLSEVAPVETLSDADALADLETIEADPRFKELLPRDQ